MSATANDPSPSWDPTEATRTTLVVSSATSWLDYLHQVANAVQDQPISEEDPVASLQPKFATSVLCQSVAYGIVFALGAVLLGLLMFSARYHWPLSKVNFAMQLAALIIFLFQITLSISILLKFSRERSRTWPYMFDYIELAFPRDTWNEAQTSAWLLLQGLTALAIHVTLTFCQISSDELIRCPPGCPHSIPHPPLPFKHGKQTHPHHARAFGIALLLPSISRRSSRPSSPRPRGLPQSSLQLNLSCECDCQHVLENDADGFWTAPLHDSATGMGVGL